MKLYFLLALTAASIYPDGFVHAQTATSSPSDWNRVVEAGKKEGRVVVSVPASAELRKDVERVFKQRFGIEAELNAGRAASIV